MLIRRGPEKASFLPYGKKTKRRKSASNLSSLQQRRVREEGEGNSRDDSPGSNVPGYNIEIWKKEVPVEMGGKSGKEFERKKKGHSHESA